MPRREPEAASTSWADIAECVPAWEAEYGVQVEVDIRWDGRLKEGAYAEVTLRELTVGGRGRELVRTRGPFPTRKGSGHPAAVMHTIFQAFAELDRNPWLWGEARRRAARGEG